MNIETDNQSINGGEQIVIFGKEYFIIQKIGRGAYGQIYTARDPKNKEVVLKLIHYKDGHINNKAILNEISFLEELKSPYIVKLLDYDLLLSSNL